jgi:ABC-type multidrug transport system fused ATPase/permease subunit
MLCHLLQLEPVGCYPLESPLVLTADLSNLPLVSRWITVRMDVLGGLFSSGLAALLVYTGSGILPASDVGFALNQAVSFSVILLYFVRMVNQFEVQANGIERINDYLQIDQEPASTEQGKPPASWPTTGDIRVENLNARYFEGGPLVLKDLSFDVPAGSRIGIVGRTGSGKSSLTLALLRMIPTEGSIRIAGIDSKHVNLQSLRKNVTIIPQEPVLLSGTLRFNLDPFDEHDDHELNDVIKTSGLEMATGEVDDESSTSALTLDSKIASGGSNLSAGQRRVDNGRDIATAASRHTNQYFHVFTGNWSHWLEPLSAAPRSWCLTRLPVS